MVAPLDWGLGHATRCIPLIDHLRERGLQVYLGGAGDSLKLLKEAYPQLPFLELPAYKVSYSYNSRQTRKIGQQVPRLLRVIRQEHRTLKKWMKTHPLSGIISDNRYGCWQPELPSVFLCHQLSPQLPQSLSFFQYPLSRLHLRFAGNFQEIWIPDFPGEASLSGKMSRPVKDLPHMCHLGPLSRFYGYAPPNHDISMASLSGKKPYLLAVLSGPEPQRSLLEEMIRIQAQSLDKPCWIIQGKWESSSVQTKGNCTLIPHMHQHDLYLALQQAEWVLSRSGYSSLMDFSALGLKKVILVPTPGQTEQEYLAHRMKQKNLAHIALQSRLKLREILADPPLVKGFETSEKSPSFMSVVDEWLCRRSK